MQYETHVTYEWQRNTLVIQVRAITDRGHTHGVAQAVEDTDTMGTLRIHPLALDEHEGIQTVTPTPGLRLPWDMAVSIAQAVIAKTKALADPSETARLQETVDLDPALVGIQDRVNVMLGRYAHGRLRPVEDAHLPGDNDGPSGE